MAAPSFTRAPDPNASVARLLEELKAKLQDVESQLLTASQKQAVLEEKISASTSPPRFSTPPPPTNFRALSGIEDVILAWDNPSSAYANHARTLIYRHNSDAFDLATQIGQTDASIFVDDDVAADSEYFYWVRFQSTGNILGQPSASASARTALDPAEVHEVIKENLSETLMTTSLLAASGGRWNQQDIQETRETTEASDFDLPGGSWRSGGVSGSTLYLPNNDKNKAFAFDSTTLSRKAGEDIELGDGEWTGCVEDGTWGKLFFIDDTANAVATYINNTAARDSANDIALGNGSWVGGASRSGYTWFIDDYAEMAKAYYQRTRFPALDFSLGAGSWVGCCAIGTMLWVLDDATNAARGFSLVSRSRDAAKDIALGSATWRGAFASGSVLRFIDDDGHAVAYDATTQKRIVGLGERWEVKSSVGGLHGGIGLYNDGTKLRFIAAADTFAILPTGAANDANMRIPFAVEGGIVYIDDAAIRNASITTAKIENAFLTNLSAVHGTLDTARINRANIFSLSVGDKIQSDNFVAGSAGFRFLKDGTAQLPALSIIGMLSANNIKIGSEFGINEDGDLVASNIQADHISADVLNTYVLYDAVTDQNTNIKSYTLSRTLIGLDSIILQGGVHSYLENRDGNTLAMAGGPVDALKVGTSASMPARTVQFNFAFGAGAKYQKQQRIWRSSDGRTLYIKAHQSEDAMWIYRIFGIRDPYAKIPLGAEPHNNWTLTTKTPSCACVAGNNVWYSEIPHFVGIAGYTNTLQARGYDADGTRASARDFTLSISGAVRHFTGAVSDGTTMWWVGNLNGWVAQKAFAVSATSPYAADPTKDIALPGARNYYMGAMTDGTTAWFLDVVGNTCHALTLSTRARDTAKDFPVIAGLQSCVYADGDFWFIKQGEKKVIVYDGTTYARKESREFTLPNATAEYLLGHATATHIYIIEIPAPYNAAAVKTALAYRIAQD